MSEHVEPIPYDIRKSDIIGRMPAGIIQEQSKNVPKETY